VSWQCAREAPLAIPAPPSPPPSPNPVPPVPVTAAATWRRCRHSHDLLIGRKAAKIDMYSDRRDAAGGAGGPEDSMADWDQAKLEEVVLTKHGKEASGAAGPKATEIVCKFFLDAIEREIYGWFWKCPNGEDCKYRHALPPGFVYKSKKQRDAEAAAKASEDSSAPTIEELIEEEVSGPRVTRSLNRPLVCAASASKHPPPRHRAARQAAHDGSDQSHRGVVCGVEGGACKAAGGRAGDTPRGGGQAHGHQGLQRVIGAGFVHVRPVPVCGRCRR